jgi:hypothetical protein
MLGNYDPTVYDNEAWALFVIASLVQVVILLNLLIAVISNTFQRVVDDEIRHTYQERCQIIHDMHVFFGSFYNLFAKPDPNDLPFIAFEEQDTRFGWVPSIMPQNTPASEEENETTLD